MVELYKQAVQVRWSDLDPNFHLRHSVYYDWGAFIRTQFLYAHGLTADVLQELRIGPILFREECIFRREIRSDDKVEIDVKLLKAKKDFSRWSIQHHITKNGDILSAVLTIDAAWLNLVERKLTTPPAVVHEVFNKIPKADAFEWIG